MPEDNYPTTATEAKMAREISPVDSALQMNTEYIQAIEKQVEVLAQRLAPVSSNEPERDDTTDRAGVRGNSSLVETVGSQGYKLSNISDRLSRLTRNLEI